MAVNTAVLCEMHFSAFFEQVRLVMGGPILTTNTATERMKEVFIGVAVWWRGQVQLTKYSIPLKVGMIYGDLSTLQADYELEIVVHSLAVPSVFTLTLGVLSA